MPPLEESTPDKTPSLPESENIKIKVKTKPKNKESSLIHDITGVSLTHPNPFFKRMQEKDPALFLVKQEGRFNAYSRICPYNIKRQPVILTDEEKENIDNKHPGSYENAIKYGSNPDKQYWYICPRYWSLKDNISLTEEDVKSGKYGKVIPENATSIPKGANIFEFNDSKYHKKNGEYVNLSPGFINQKSHPNNLCIPCCFKSWNSKEQQKRREECSNQMELGKEKQIDNKDKLKHQIDPIDSEILDNTRDLEILKNEKAFTFDNYIKGPEKFPLEIKRWGYLPIIVQRFLQTNNKKCQISNINTSLKTFHPCLLRYGIETSKNQSFIGCIASVYTEYNEQHTTPSIKEMKEIIISAIDVDKFIKYNNANLIQLFANKNDDQKINDTQIDNYLDSNLYKSIQATNDKQLTFFKKVVNAYENFIEFMRNDAITIDHSYLWDIISNPNDKLFPHGLNIFIMEIIDNDITDNINVLCPTNHYSNEFYDSNKKTLLLIKNKNYFEPIFSLEDTQIKFKITTLFNLKNKTYLGNVIKILNNIKNSINEKCGPLPSMPKIYKFKQNIVLDRIIKILWSQNYEILNQILNYNGKVIGVIASKKSLIGFIPSYPSSVSKLEGMEDIEIMYMDDNIWTNYMNTINFLKMVHSDSKGSIICAPKIKIIDDGLIVGILTEANQFVSLDKPEIDNYGDDLEIVTNSNYSIVDENIDNSEVDEVRVKYVKNIELESKFYYAFRNIIRLLLGEYRHIKIRNKIEEIMKKPYLQYLTKLKNIDALLRDLTKNEVIFTKYNTGILNQLNHITNCFNKEDCQDKKFCMITGEGKCKIIIPKENLINKQDNESIYYAKMADELIRYNRVKMFIFEPKAYLSFSNVKYNLTDNEILILQSLITQDYFDNLSSINVNPYIINNAYDVARPENANFYTEEAEFKEYSSDSPISDKEHKVIKDIMCNVRTSALRGVWESYFPSGSQDLYYEITHEICTYELILTIIKDHNLELISMTKHELKNELVNIYKTYDDKIMLLLLILATQNPAKNAQIKRVLSGEMVFDDLLLSENYFITNMDIWVIAKHYDIPLIFISGTKLQENDENLLVANYIKTDFYYFIKSPGVRGDSFPVQKLIVYNSDAKIKVSKMAKSIQDKIRKNEDNKFFDTYIEGFSQLKKKKKIKLKIISSESPKQEQEQVQEQGQEQEQEQEQEQKKSIPIKKGKIKLNVIN